MLLRSSRYARVVLASLAISACNGPRDGTAPPPNAGGSATPQSPAAAETVVRVEDDGKSFDVARGATITFRLAANGGTGYVWMPTQVDQSLLTQQGDRSSETSSEVPGAPKMDVYRFVAGASPGSTTVEMTLRRPFGSGAPARVVHVTVNVK